MLGRRLVACVVVGLGGAGLLAVPAAAGAWAAPARVAAGVWGKAIGVPGLGVLNKGGSASVRSVSCTSAGNCSAGGSYTIRPGDVQGFVVTERFGRWGRASEVPGLAALNKGGQAEVLSVSCTSKGNCAAGGDYRSSRGRNLGFVAVQKNGVWSTAVEVPGLGTLDRAGPAGVSQVSCRSAGDCVVGGSYSDSVRHQQGFVAVEKNGVWGRAIEVPGLGALNQGGSAAVTSVSCGSGRSCGAVGYYTDSSGHQGFLDSETNGTWGQAIEVPGLAALNQGGGAEALTVSCASAGNCGVGGYYTDDVTVDGNYGNVQGFVADEKNGVWDQAIEVPGLGALNAEFEVQAAFTDSVSCTAPGDCLAAGTYGQPYSWAFVASEKNGIWGSAGPVPGLQNLVSGRYAELGTASCASTGNCAVGGDYENVIPGNVVRQGFAGSERNGRWSNAVNMPGETALSRRPGLAEPLAVSCGATGHCTAAGFFTDGHDHLQGFVTQAR